MNILNLVLGIVGIAGVIGTFYYGIKSMRMARERNRFSWADVEKGCIAMGKAMRRKIRPDAIACFSGPSSIVAHLIIEQCDYFVPVYTIILEKPDQKRVLQGLSGWHSIETAKWRLHIPESLLLSKPQRLCIIDDAVVTGDSLKMVSEILTSNGIAKEGIWSCALLCTNVAKMGKKAPDMYYFLIEGSIFHLPWGEGY